jgi:hypothetical protein
MAETKSHPNPKEEIASGMSESGKDPKAQPKDTSKTDKSESPTTGTQDKSKSAER